MKKRIDFEDRLIAFAGDVMLFAMSLPTNFTNEFLLRKIVKSSGNSALYYASSQLPITQNSDAYKKSVTLNELMQTMVNFKIMSHIGIRHERIKDLAEENAELIKILSSAAKNTTNQA